MEKILSLWRKYSYMLLLAFILASPFDFRIGIAAVVCMVAPLIVSIFKGRYWCGNVCPRGNFYDNVLSKFSNKKPVPKFLKSISFRAFVIVLMFAMFGFGIKNNWSNPAGIGMVFYRIVAITTVVGIIMSFFYNERTWCHFCPMGSLSALISYFRRGETTVLEVSNSCVSCNLCTQKCPMGISALNYKGDVLSHPDCIQCSQCVISCPKNSIGYGALESTQEKYGVK